MNEAGWKRYIHRQDESVVYEARKTEDLISYEMRKPNNPSEVFVLLAEDFERYYERDSEKEG